MLNALFGRELCKVDVLPTDRIYVFKYGEEERNVAVTRQLTECYRPTIFLRDFNIVDTGNEHGGAEHQTSPSSFAAIGSGFVCFQRTNPGGERVGVSLDQQALAETGRVHRPTSGLGNRMKLSIVEIRANHPRALASMSGILLSARQALEAKMDGGDLSGTGFRDWKRSSTTRSRRVNRD
jgi:hypothetical protein